MISLEQTVAKAHKTGDYNPLIELIPYANVIGVNCERFGEEMVFRLPRNPDNLGNPTLPAIHGGVIAAFMELSAAFQVLLQTTTPELPKIIDFSVDYMRAGLDRDTFAMCQLERQGRRVTNCSVIAWQEKRTEPIATARAHFLVKPVES